MTKKSLARQQRDVKAKEDQIKAAAATVAFEKQVASGEAGATIWDEINDLHNQFISLIDATHTGLLQLYSDKTTVAFIDPADKNNVIVGLRGIEADTTKLAGELNDIRKFHEGRSGAATDADDFIRALDICEQYTAFQVRYDAVIEPTRNILVNAIAKAADRRAEVQRELYRIQEEALAKNPNVVTDAAPKEAAEVVPTATPEPV